MKKLNFSNFSAPGQFLEYRPRFSHPNYNQEGGQQFTGPRYGGPHGGPIRYPGTHYFFSFRTHSKILYYRYATRGSKDE